MGKHGFDDATVKQLSKLEKALMTERLSKGSRREAREEGKKLMKRCDEFAKDMDADFGRRHKND